MKNCHGFPAEITTSFGFFHTKFESAKMKNSVMIFPTMTAERIANAKKVRQNRS